MRNQVSIGIIGCGGFARGVHIPNLLANAKFCIIATCDTDLAAAQSARELFSARYATTDVERVLSDAGIDAILVATRHDSHGSLTIRAAQAGKHVLCEKPMGLSEGECRRVAAAVRTAGVVYTVGYNRGMAPLVLEAKDVLEGHVVKRLIYHRIQAPFPVDHWIHSASIGGGRFVGEGCHIFDLLCELVSSPPVSVYASGGVFLDAARVRVPDSGIVVLTFADGSVGTTLIASDGCSAYPKESTEIYCDGMAIEIADYQELFAYAGGAEPVRHVRLDAVDKGHERETDLFADAILEGAPPPNGLKSAFRAALISYLAGRSISSGEPQPIRESDYDV